MGTVIRLAFLGMTSEQMTLGCGLLRWCLTSRTAKATLRKDLYASGSNQAGDGRTGFGAVSICRSSAGREARVLRLPSTAGGTRPFPDRSRGERNRAA